MPKTNNLYKIAIFTPRETIKVSKHRFSWSRNHFLALDFMCDEQKTKIGEIWVLAFRRKLSKLSEVINMTPSQVKEVSKNRFSGSRNLIPSINFIFNDEKTLIGTWWVPTIMLKLSKRSYNRLHMPPWSQRGVKLKGLRIKKHFLSLDIKCDEEKWHLKHVSLVATIYGGRF